MEREGREKDNYLSVWELVALLEGGGRGSGLHLLLEVEGDVGELLLDVTDDFTLGGGGEGVTTLSEDLHEVVWRENKYKKMHKNKLRRENKKKKIICKIIFANM